ncbi:MAG: DUF5343 domain-containing protein, partial [Alphaproteobacteria bacterium]|nr:DUF5343 domain-containing protein [Alphaproteobacteria bacterium]
DGAPQERYYSFLDRSVSGKILAEGIKEAYSDLFAVNTSAHQLDANKAFNKLRTLYKGEKKDSVIKNIAKTFSSLCDYADFSSTIRPEDSSDTADEGTDPKIEKPIETGGALPKQISLESLQYHINIVLPDTRDQAVYDAIFKSLRDHLG